MLSALPHPALAAARCPGSLSSGRSHGREETVVIARLVEHHDERDTGEEVLRDRRGGGNVAGCCEYLQQSRR